MPHGRYLIIIGKYYKYQYETPKSIRCYCNNKLKQVVKSHSARVINSRFLIFYTYFNKRNKYYYSTYNLCTVTIWTQ